MPRRRRGARAVAVETDAERGLAMRILLHSPKDLVAGVLAFAAVSAIIANALFLQAGHHPSPMFGSVVAIPAAGLAPPSPLPRSRPVELATKPADTSPPESKPVESRSAELKSAELKPAEIKPAEPKAEPKAAEPKAADPLANLVKATAGMPVTANGPRPPASIPTAAQAAHRVAAVQRVLTEYGYGQLKPTGTIGSDTQAAIQKFERERKLPVTGQMSDRLVRDLVAMTGHPID
jgi:putative peptidoglycan binding protein